MPSRENPLQGLLPTKCTCNVMIHTLTPIQVKICTFLHECLHVMPMSRVLADSLTHAFYMYEKLFSKQNIFIIENSLDKLRYQNTLDNPLMSKYTGQPSGIITYWTTLRYHNVLDNPLISKSFIDQPSDIIHSNPMSCYNALKIP